MARIIGLEIPETAAPEKRTGPERPPKAVGRVKKP